MKKFLDTFSQTKKRKKQPEPTAEVANVVLRIKGGGNPSDNSEDDEDPSDERDINWKRSDDYFTKYAQDYTSEGEEDISKVHGIAGDDFHFPSNAISEED